jgi:hypothetical protein
MLDDGVFIAKLNEIAREKRLRLPDLRSGEPPSADFLEEWAKFLEECVKRGITLSDERWQTLTLASRSPYAVFAIEKGTTSVVDPDFRVGLQLLMGLLGTKDNEH